LDKNCLKIIKKIMIQLSRIHNFSLLHQTLYVLLRYEIEILIL